MPVEVMHLPNSESIRKHVLAALRCYWSADLKGVAELPVTKKSPVAPISGPLRLIEIPLPDWASHCGIDGYLLVPLEAESGNWQQTDWWLAAFLLLEAWHERVWEKEHGPIHSYSFHLKGWDERAWQHAWVNRIGLFLRQWAIQKAGKGGEDKIGPLPTSKMHMTHDVDAVAKTLPIRLKQGAFNLFNALQSVRRGQFHQTAARLRQAARFLLGHENWWTFDRLQKWESDSDIRATYHFHADPLPKTLKRWLFDPGYDIASPTLKTLLHQLAAQGHTVGLHPSFETWQGPEQIAAQRACVEQSAGVQVTHCRQHWLRFSWQSTWLSQQTAGLTQDATLMFNDRPGFRNSSALAWHPWDTTHAAALNHIALPSVFMDSHFYNYHPMTPAARQIAMRHWLQECHSVGGQIAVLWHPHTLTTDYGWSDGFRDAVKLIKELQLCQ